MDSITSTHIERWLRDCANVFPAHGEELNTLDSAIGDGDHGANMARGFTALPPKLDGLAGKEIDGLFRTTATTLISQVGGASGPLYGTFFLKAATPAKGKLELTLPEFCACLDAGLAGIVGLGKAVVGDKTMVDVLTPALAALHPKDGDSLAGALDRAVATARQAAEDTIPLLARKGRASYLGERSIGHKDPGATSSALLLATLLGSVQG
jgi:phosphoenolpyruvate---glycerone phosphotransferase subunit DhaL